MAWGELHALQYIIKTALLMANAVQTLIYMPIIQTNCDHKLFFCH